MPFIFDDTNKKTENDINKQNVSKPQPTTAPQVVKPMQAAKTAYQQNISQPVQQNPQKWYKGTIPTTGEIYGRIQTIGQTDPSSAQQIAIGFAQAQQDKSSPWYNPYLAPTNQAVGNLKSLGVDTSILTDEWFKNNTGWQSRLRYSTTTNGVLQPLKKSATDEDWIAYNLYQYQKSMEDTQKADTEWAALQQELTYKAGRKDRNYSDDAIINGIDWSKYPTLRRMQESKGTPSPIELNHANDFSDDGMRAVLWAARNNGGTGSIYSDMAASAMGEGNVWKDNPELSAKLNWNNKDTYAPYSVGMTLDPEVGMYFGVYSIDQDTLDQLRSTIDPNDETAVKMYQKAQSAWDTTQKAEEELARLNSKIDKWVSDGNYTYDDIQEKIDKELAKTGKNGYPTLIAMNDSIINGSKLVETTRAVNFSRNELNTSVQQRLDARKTVPTGDDKLAEINEPVKTVEEINKEANAILDEEEKAAATQKPQEVDAVSGAAPMLTYDQIEQRYIERLKNGETIEPMAPLSGASPMSSDADIEQRFIDSRKGRETQHEYTEHWPETESRAMTGSSPMLSESEIEARYNKAQDEIANETADRLINQPANAGIADKKTGASPKRTPEDLKRAYDSKYGEGAYEMDVKMANAPREQTAVEQEEAIQNRKFAIAADVLSDLLTQKQRELYSALPQIKGTRLANAYYEALQGTLVQGPVSDNLKNAEWVTRMATKNADKAEKNYQSTVLGNLSFRNEFEQAQADSRELWAIYDKYAPVYEAEKLASQAIPEMLQVTIDGTDIPLVFRMNADGVYEYHQSDNIDFANSLDTQEYLSSRGMTMDDLNLIIREQKSRANERADSARIARENMEIPVLSDEERAAMPSEEELEKIRKRATAKDEYIAENQDRYNQVLDENDMANARRMRTSDITLDMSGIAVDPKVSDAVIDYVGGFAGWERPADEYDSLVEGLRQYYGYNGIAGTSLDEKLNGEQIAELSDYINVLDEKIKDTEFLLENYDNIPEEYRAKMQEYLDYSKSNIRQYEAFALTQEENYGDLVEKGKKLYWDDIMTQHNAGGVYDDRAGSIGWQQMTDLERDIYYALIADKGFDAAEQYYADIEGSLIYRTQENIRMGAEETAESGVLGRLFTEVASIGMAGLEVPLNLLYLADTAKNGEGSEWARIPSYAAKTANEAVINKQKEIYGGTIWGTIIPELTQMVNNRGRSAVVGQLFGTMLPDGAGDIFHAMPIATIAMGDAVEQGIEAGLEDWQIWTLGAVNFIAESFTEGIKFGHIDESLNGMSALTLKEFLTDKFKDMEWLEEATGETLNNIVERWANYLVAGDKGDHARKIQELLDSGTAENRKEAEWMAFGDYISEDIHTAIVSGLSSFMDVGFFAIGRMGDTISYAKQVDSLRRMGDTTTTIRDLRNRDAAMIRSARELQKMQERSAQQEDGSAVEQTADQTAEAETVSQTEGTADNRMAMKESRLDPSMARQYDVDMTILDNATDGDQTSQTSTIAAVMRTDGRNDAQSMAAATAMVAQNGEQTIESLQELLQGGIASGTNINQLKLGLQYALLGNGECTRVMNSTDYQSADIADKAQMLADATLADARNMEVKVRVNKAVRENRVMIEEQRLMAERSDELAQIEKTAEQAEKNTSDRQKDLDTQHGVEEAAADATRRAGEAVANDPSPDNLNALTHAVTEQENQSKVTQEFQQSLDRATREMQGIRNDAEQRKDAIYAEIRTQAETNVAQAEQQETADAEQQRQEEQEARRQQMIQDQRSGKLEEASNEAKIRRLAEQRGYTGEQAEQFVQDVLNFAKDRTMSRIDMTKQLTDSEGYLMMGALTRRFGINVVLADTPNGVNGYYDKATDSIVLNKNLTGGQVLVEFALHELTHSLEKTGHYDQYSDTVLNALFQSEAELQKGIADMIAAREEAGYPIGETQAKREIVAEFTRTRLNDKAMVQRMVDAGIGGRIRNSLHNVNQFLRNKKLGDAERIEAEKLRRAERMFQKAIVDRERMQKRDEWLAENRTPEAMKQRTAKPMTTENGTAITSTLSDGTVVKDDNVEFSISSWTEDEIKKVRKNLLKSGFTEEQADKWIGDVNSIAAIIASDKERLDFTPDRTQKFKKPNGDVYKWTLDASTLCAKRLLYQGTFNAIQKLMPNTPLYAGDLIDLSNMMRDMGYQTPCGICYVESQRRDGGKFTQEFIEKYRKEHPDGWIPTYADLTTSDGLYQTRDKHKEVYDAYIKANNARGSGSTKPVQLRTDYRGDVRTLTADSIRYLKNIGGLRIQSFSDFETPHLMDMMQAVLDMSAVHLTSQAYTKVPNFAAVFGDTGIKINLSLMGEGTGVDENGNLIFSSVEGMDFDEAMELRDRYSKNVGTILVGMNDAHILAAMADPRIDYIIPFHRSGWSEENRKRMTSLANYDDYQDYQNERDIKTGKKAESNIEPGYVVNPDGTTDGYWDYNKTGKENAERYLDLCFEKGLIPKFEQFLDKGDDGHYHLKADGSTDGYWKLLIDFKMYDNDGNGAPQQEVTPNINMEEAYRVLDEFDGTGVNSLPVAQDVVEAYVEKYKADHPDQEYSAGTGELTEAEKNQALIDAGIIENSIGDVNPPNNLPGTPVGENGTAQRQFGYQTAQESDALHDSVKDYLYTHSDYTPDSNNAQINRAISWVQSKANDSDPDGYYAAVNEVTSEGFDYRSADGQARMLTVMGMAALRGDEATELRIANAYNSQGTDIARALQARKIFRLMTPIGRRMTLQQEVARINQDYINSNKDTRVALSEWTLKAAEEAKTEEDFAKVQKHVEQELAEQMPANWKDKLRTWRMMSMLANPRTHVRNIIGNLIFVPTVGIKNAIGTGLESVFVKDGERTKAIRFTDDAKAFAEQDVKAMKDTLTGEAKYSPEDKIKQEQKAFGQGDGIISRTAGKAVQGLADLTSWALEAEDWIFLNHHYQTAMASYMTANNLTSADMTGDTLTKARDYAVLEAQKATYRDANAISSWLNNASRNGGIWGFTVDAVLPFKKTPANILRRGIEYSPVGLVKSLATAKKSIDLYTAWDSNGRKGKMPKGAKSLTQVLDSVASGLTGTGIAAIGAIAYALGAVRLSFGKRPDDELDELKGSQEYSIELFGKSFTIDWAAPVCMPFFTGAAIAEQYFNKGKDFNIISLLDAITQITEPVFNLSMLDGVNTLLSATKYSSNQNKLPIGDLIQKIGANYVSSVVPSALGAIARTVDPTRRKSYVESGADAAIWRQMLEQAQNKIPYLSAKNIPYRNVWGEADTNSVAWAAIENFLLPGYGNEIKEDDLVDELQRLFDQTGDKDVIPKEAGKTVGSMKLTAEQQDQYVVTRGQTARRLLDELIGNPDFLILTPTELSEGNPEAQVQLVKDVWQYANAVARKELQPDYKMDKWIAEAYESKDPISAIFKREETKAQNSYASASQADMFKAIDMEDADAVRTALEGLKQAGKDEKAIRTSVMNHYRDQYKAAFLADDEDTMDKIKSGMAFLDLGDYSFDEDDSIFDSWEKNATSKQEEKEAEEES